MHISQYILSSRNPLNVPLHGTFKEVHTIWRALRPSCFTQRYASRNISATLWVYCFTVHSSICALLQEHMDPCELHNALPTITKWHLFECTVARYNERAAHYAECIENCVRYTTLYLAQRCFPTHYDALRSSFMHHFAAGFRVVALLHNIQWCDCRLNCFLW